MDNPSTLPIAIVGGGITGLSAAYHLARRGRAVRLFEASPRLGGAIRSERDDGWLIEAGPNSVQESAPLAALIRDLGLDKVKLTAQPVARNRFIVRDGRLRTLPLSPPAFLKSGLFSTGTKLRVLKELFRRRGNRASDVSVADFIRDHFGQELLDYALDPFVSGVYAGDPARLSTRHAFPSLWAAERTHGSVIRAQIANAQAKRRKGERAGPPPIITFTEGLGILPKALAAALPSGSVETSARVERLVRDGDAWLVRWTRDGAMHEERFALVLLALPAPALTALAVGPADVRPLAGLDVVEYPPVSSLFLGYRRDQVAHPLDGFGALIPSVEKRELLGVLFSSSLFPGRAPEGHVALTVMSGGAANPAMGRLPLAELLPRVQKELASLLGVTGDPVFVRHTAWPRAIPQYNLGYDTPLAVIGTFEIDHPGLLVGGHVRDGIALPACVAAGEKLASRALV